MSLIAPARMRADEEVRPRGQAFLGGRFGGERAEPLAGGSYLRPTVLTGVSPAMAIATPFDGMKASGHGRDRSLHALDQYTQLKATWVAL